MTFDGALVLLGKPVSKFETHHTIGIEQEYGRAVDREAVANGSDGGLVNFAERAGAIDPLKQLQKDALLRLMLFALGYIPDQAAQADDGPARFGDGIDAQRAANRTI